MVGLLADGFETTVVVPDATRHAFRQQLTVPAGVTARDGDIGVVLVDRTGRAVGAYGSGTAVKSGDRPDDSEVRTRLVGQSGTTVTVEVSVDPSWLGDPGRRFPVAIDPTFTTTTKASGGLDTYVQTNITATPQSASPTLKVGRTTTTPASDAGPCCASTSPTRWPPTGR